jgi:hypothetical protein
MMRFVMSDEEIVIEDEGAMEFEVEMEEEEIEKEEQHDYEDNEDDLHINDIYVD